MKLANDAKEILAKYYLIPFPNQKKSDINRPIHGAVHATRTALYVEHLHNLHREYNQCVAGTMSNLESAWGIPQSDILYLTQIAALLHDSARENDAVDLWDKQSGENCTNYIQQELERPEKIAEYFGAVIAYKDDEKRFHDKVVELNEKFGLSIRAHDMDYIRMLVADSDCIDIIRCVPNFQPTHLKLLGLPGFSSDKANRDVMSLIHNAAKLIALQGDARFATSMVGGQRLLQNEHCAPALKRRFELAEDVLSETTAIFNQYCKTPLPRVGGNGGAFFKRCIAGLKLVVGIIVLLVLAIKCRIISSSFFKGPKLDNSCNAAAHSAQFSRTRLSELKSNAASAANMTHGQSLKI